MASEGNMANVNGKQAASLNGEPVVKRPRENVQQDVSLRIPKEPQNKVTVVLGAQWGDEGKGKVVDLLAMDADIVCRCQVPNYTTVLTLQFLLTTSMRYVVCVFLFEIQIYMSAREWKSGCFFFFFSTAAVYIFMTRHRRHHLP